MMRLLICLCGLVLAACASETVQAPAVGGNPTNPGGSNNQGGNNGNAGGNNQATCPDRDRDGYQDAACNQRINGQPRGGDCDDYNNLVNPGRSEDCGNMVDNNCNGQLPARDQACLANCPDQDQDGYVSASCNSNRATGGDCNDQDPAVNPGQVERCGNGKDDDCSGGDLSCRMNCQDNDQDGFGVGSGCYGPDCNDNDRTVNPWASEICGDRIDQDCDREDRACPMDCQDTDRDGFGEGPGCLGFDCNDRNPNINPGARDIPDDGIDQDCDQRDLRIPANCQDLDRDGYGQGAGCLGSDCDDNDPRVHATRIEVCGNGRDDDCQGGDRPCVMMGSGMCMDMDGDQYGAGACPNGNYDCDERNPNINPGAEEICNGMDDDCDNQTDECPHRLQVCDGNFCVGSAGAPCLQDVECGPDAGLYCNRDLGQCRLRDGELCNNSEECNPSAECALVNACDAERRCYQNRGGPCLESCDCTGKWLCQNGFCVECTSDVQCNDGLRNSCTTGGFCIQDLPLPGQGGGGGGQVCDNTCRFADDDDCDDGGPDSDTSFCDFGTDCNDCGPREQGGGNAVEGDTLMELLNLMIRCWSTHRQATDNQGCYELRMPAQLVADGVVVNQLGDAEVVQDTVCDGGGGADGWRRSNGFSREDSNILGDIFGCGLLDLKNLYWLQPLISGGGNMCMYYSPAKSGFGFPDDTRAAVVLDSCNLSHLE